jgi:hypothetical protein
MAANSRAHKRQSIYTGGAVYDGSGRKLTECHIRNVSVGGAQLELSEDLALPQVFTLSLTQSGNVRRACRRIWQFSTVVGVRFDKSAD